MRKTREYNAFIDERKVYTDPILSKAMGRIVKMNKIPSNQARKRPEIKFADEFLKGKIQSIAETWKDKCNTEQERLTAHGTLAAQVAALCMDIVVMYSGDDVKKLGGTGGVYKLNKYLALRQLCDRQIAGIQEGHWGLTPEFAKSDPFISTVKLSQGLFITREEIADFLNVVEILNAPEDSETLDCELTEALGGQSKSEESSQKCESDLKD